MSELGPDARAILEAARGGDDPTDADRRRVHASLARKIGVGAAIVGTTTAAAGSAGGATIVAGVSSLTKVVLVVVGVIGAVGGGAYVVHRATMPEPVRAATTASPAPRATTTIATTTATTIATTTVGLEPTKEPTAPPPLDEPTKPLEKQPEIAPPPVAAAPTPTPTSAPSAKLDDEIALVQQAQSALAAGDTTKALQLLDEHEKKFPNGALSEESAGARVLAYCQLGRSDAQARAKSFLSAHPSSPMAAHVRSACGVE